MVTTFDYEKVLALLEKVKKLVEEGMIRHKNFRAE